VSAALSLVLAAQRSGYPDFTVGVAYRFRGNPMMDNIGDFYSIKFGINLPLFYGSKAAPQAREAAARLEERRAALEAARQRIRYEVERLRAELTQWVHLAHHHERILRPLSTRALEAVLPAYQAGQADIDAILSAWNTNFATDFETVRAVAMAHAKAEQLEAAMGRSHTRPASQEELHDRQ
jgi:outer membrane protein TolC